jgi:hypothetical protein
LNRLFRCRRAFRNPTCHGWHYLDVENPTSRRRPHSRTVLGGVLFIPCRRPRWLTGSNSFQAYFGQDLFICGWNKEQGNDREMSDGLVSRDRRRRPRVLRHPDPALNIDSSGLVNRVDCPTESASFPASAHQPRRSTRPARIPRSANQHTYLARNVSASYIVLSTISSIFPISMLRSSIN